jgi:N-acetylmuramoyl-L-alanine amidase
MRSLKVISSYLAAAAAGAGLLGLVLWLGHAPQKLVTDPGTPDPRHAPPDEYRWTDQPAPAFPLPPYARFLAGTLIVVDPGHGGRADRENWKRGPTGLREAEVNLSVAQFLRDFLVAAGAEVIMTRTTDVYLDPDIGKDNRKRAAIANDHCADLLLSIHHNAANKPEVNYTVLFYHGNAAENPASVCAARHLLTGLNDALRLDDHLPCAVLSDHRLFNNGLGLLREARVPAVLSEASFHSNPQEEQRLRDPVYNRREAYGHLLGLARWAQAGLPRIRLAKPDDQVKPGGTFEIELDDGLKSRGGWGSDSLHIFPDSLRVHLNGQNVTFTTDLKRGRLRVNVPKRLTGSSTWLYVDFANVFGQQVLHPWLELPLAVPRR